ncbi:MAG: hypothetical protein K6A42_07935 [Treponema sp.]|nr:hypothetical protein [Treponema sp.]
MKKIFAALCLMLTVVCSSWAAKKEKKLKTAEMEAKEFSLETACQKKWDLVTLRNVMFITSGEIEGDQLYYVKIGAQDPSFSGFCVLWDIPVWKIDIKEIRGMKSTEEAEKRMDELIEASKPAYFRDNPDDWARLTVKNPVYTVQIKINKIVILGYRKYDVDVEIVKVEGGPSLEEIKAKEEAEAKKKAEQEAAYKKQQEEERAAKDEKAKKYVKGYIYHGAEEEAANAKLFANGALESGHAYLVSGFVISDYSNDWGSVILSFFRSEDYINVKYIDQKTKGEVVGASKTAFGNFPVTIVVAGGNDITHTPVILGLVK